MDEPAEEQQDDAVELEEDSTGPPEGGRSRPALVLAISLAVVFAIAAAVLGVLAARDAGGDERVDDVRKAAGAFGEALVTYDYHDPDAHRDAVLALSTGSFREEYEDAFDQGLAKIISEVEATSKGFVKDVYVSDIGEDDAQAIVVVDIEHSGSGGPRTLFDVYFRLTFVRVDGAWKVDQVTDLNFDTGAGGVDPTASTTSTTVSGSSTTSIP